MSRNEDQSRTGPLLGGSVLGDNKGSTSFVETVRTAVSNNEKERLLRKRRKSRLAEMAAQFRAKTTTKTSESKEAEAGGAAEDGNGGRGSRFSYET